MPAQTPASTQPFSPKSAFLLKKSEMIFSVNSALILHVEKTVYSTICDKDSTLFQHLFDLMLNQF